MCSRCRSVEKSRKRSLPAKKATGKKSNFRTVATGSCLTFKYHRLEIKKKLRKEKNDCAQHNEQGASFVGQVVWNTEPVLLFSLDILFFFSCARVGLVKKSDAKPGAYTA